MAILMFILLVALLWALRGGRFPWSDIPVLLASMLLAFVVSARFLRRYLRPAATSSDPASSAASAPGSEADLTAGLAAAWESASHPRVYMQSPAFQRAIEILASGERSDEELLARTYDDSESLNMPALAALAKRNFADLESHIIACLGNYTPWSRFVALRILDERHPAPEPWVHLLLVQLDATWFDAWNLRSLREWIQVRHAAGERPPGGEAWERWSGELSEERTMFYTNLVDALGPFVARTWGLPSSAFSTAVVFDAGEDSEAPAMGSDLANVGKQWTRETMSQVEKLELPAEIAEVARRIESNLRSAHPRPTVVVGRPRTGKTTLVRHVLRRMVTSGWTGFEASADEVNAGLAYLGQLEARTTALAQLVRPGQHCVWVVPDMTSMLWAGASSSDQGRTIARILRSDLRDRHLVVLGECTRAEWEHALVEAPWMGDCFEVIEVPVPNVEQTMEMAQKWAATHAGRLEVPPGLIRETWELTRQFLEEENRPGNLLDGLRLVLERAEREHRKEVGRADVLRALSERTGLPLALLDDRETLEVDAVEREFNERVHGQREVVRCIVDRLAMIKSGVTDPNRPLGVFLFAGPTGTGKTELAKTLARWLFGSEGRLVRLDMSELREYGALDKILGTREAGAQPGLSLLDRVRQQPFSVILLDEFEKSDPSVWDLFLQVFDDGRLADRRGRVADFRHSILLMTSNLGGRIEKGPGLGFAGADRTFEAQSVHKAIERAFRPEFLNRIDRTLVFQPLSRQTMRTILLSQIGRIHQRRGLRDRPWAIEWDDSAIEFLLEHGFTRELGARPLQRALDRFLLAPLARTITTNQVPDGDQFLFIRGKEDALAIEFIDPDAPDTDSEPVDAWVRAASASTRSIAQIASDAIGTGAELATLDEELQRLESSITGEAWSQARQAELDSMTMDGFWDSAERFAVLDRFERRERVERALAAARSVHSRLVGEGRSAVASKPVRRLALRLHVLGAAIHDLRTDQPGEVGLLLHCPEGEPRSVAFLERLRDMYERWARERGARIDSVSPQDLDAGLASWAVVVEGFGTHALLTAETGIHVLETPAGSGSRVRRDVVTVHAVGLPPTGPTSGSDSRRVAEALRKDFAADASRVTRRYQEEPSPLVRDRVRGFRTGRLRRVLDGEFDLMHGDASGDGDSTSQSADA